MFTFSEIGGLEAVKTTVSFKVGMKESIQDAFIAESGEELVVRPPELGAYR